MQAPAYDGAHLSSEENKQPAAGDKTAMMLIDVQAGLDEPRLGERNNPAAERNIMNAEGFYLKMGAYKIGERASDYLGRSLSVFRCSANR